MPPQNQPAHPGGLFATQRMDTWWVQPLLLFLILAGFVVYATFRVLEGYSNPHQFTVDNGVYHYLSPFGTPDLTFLTASWAGGLPPVMAAMLTNPAFLILPFPAGFRFTCYYYRKAYYRSFVARPAACSTEAAKGVDYKGEKGLLIFQNLHRYFLYAALIITVFLAYDALLSIFTPNGLYVGLGSGIMIINVVLLTGYTLGCHSFRHLVGGRLDCFSCDAASMSRHSIWQGVTRLNMKHGTWAMASLISVAVTDAYIRWIHQTGATHVSIFGLGVPV